MENLKKQLSLLKVMTYITVLFISFSCEKDDSIDNNDDPTTKAAYPTYGWMDADFDIAQRGIVEITPCGPAYIDCQWVPCDPVVTVIMPCMYPNGFCQTITVSGTINNNNGLLGVDVIALPDGTTTTTSTGNILPNKKKQGGIIRISLPVQKPVTEAAIKEQLKGDVQESDTVSYDDMVEKIVNNVNVGEDSPLSEELVRTFREQNSDAEFEKITVLKGEYPIVYTEKHPNGYINVLVNIE